jgi:hypothetical protein
MDYPFMPYLIGIFVILVSIGLVMEVRDTSQATAETANTQLTQGISSEDQVEATCDYEANTVACDYKTAIERCGKTILDANPLTNDLKDNDDVVTRYNKCVEPYRSRAQRSNADLAPPER